MVSGKEEVEEQQEQKNGIVTAPLLCTGVQQYFIMLTDLIAIFSSQTDTFMKQNNHCSRKVRNSTYNYAVCRT